MKQRTIDYCRLYYKLPDDVTDADIEEKCAGTLGHAFGDLYWAIEDLKAAIKESLPKWLKRIFKISA